MILLHKRVRRVVVWLAAIKLNIQNLCNVACAEVSYYGNVEIIDVYVIY